MYWNAYRLSCEGVLGSFHVVFRGRRTDCDRRVVWDEILRDVIYPPGDIDDLDLPTWILEQVALEIAPYRRRKGPE